MNPSVVVHSRGRLSLCGGWWRVVWNNKQCSHVSNSEFPGHAVHCSLLHHQGEKFSSELEVSALSLAHNTNLNHDIVECQTKHKETQAVATKNITWPESPILADSSFKNYFSMLKKYFNET